VPDGDDQSPWRQWSLRFEPQQLRRAFRETAGANRIEVLATSSTGRVRRARVIGPAGSLDLSGGELRQRLGLRSTLVEFRFEEPAGDSAAGGSAPGAPGGMGAGIAAATARAAAAARYGGGWWSGRDADVPSSARQTSPTGPSAAPPPPPLPALVDSATGAVAEALVEGPDPAQPAPALRPQLPALEVVGRGFGHGVGMSQWGAYALALRGKEYGAILRHYYRGAELVPYAGR